MHDFGGFMAVQAVPEVPLTAFRWVWRQERGRYRREEISATLR